METLDELLSRFDGRPIPHCAGRYVLRGADRNVRPELLVSPHGAVTEHLVPKARDTVVVTRLGQRGDWGLISYARSDGTWLHTANTPEGFRRKLTELGVAFPVES
jgi:hypothetical protein